MSKQVKQLKKRFVCGCGKEFAYLKRFKTHRAKCEGNQVVMETAGSSPDLLAMLEKRLQEIRAECDRKVSALQLEVVDLRAQVQRQDAEIQTLKEQVRGRKNPAAWRVHGVGVLGRGAISGSDFANGGT